MELLQATHRHMLADLVTLKCEVRERVTRIEAMETHLDGIEQSIRELSGD